MTVLTAKLVYVLLLLVLRAIHAFNYDLLTYILTKNRLDIIGYTSDMHESLTNMPIIFLSRFSYLQCRNPIQIRKMAANA